MWFYGQSPDFIEYTIKKPHREMYLNSIKIIFTWFMLKSKTLYSVNITKGPYLLISPNFNSYYTVWESLLLMLYPSLPNSSSPRQYWMSSVNCFLDGCQILCNLWFWSPPLTPSSNNALSFIVKQEVLPQTPSIIFDS